MITVVAKMGGVWLDYLILFRQPPHAQYIYKETEISRVTFADPAVPRWWRCDDY